MEYINSVSELNYMTQIVIMLYEDPTKVLTNVSCLFGCKSANKFLFFLVLLCFVSSGRMLKMMHTHLCILCGMVRLDSLRFGRIKPVL